MKKSKSANYWRLTSSAIILLAVAALIPPMNLTGQGYYKVEVRNTNCPVSNHEADLWYFGQNAGIDFTNDIASPALDNWVLNALQGSANICDSTGNLLLMTDGMRVWDRMQQQMPNGANLHGDGGVTMPAIIIPKPGDESIYYIFTVDRPQLYPADTNVYGLRYSEVNLTLNNGLGDVTSKKNRPLVPEVSEKVTSVLHANGVDYWVVTHRWDSDQFISIRVTSDGVDTTGFVTSNVGTSHTGPISTNNSIGQMKISPDGSRLALAVNGKKMFEVFNFDNLTGRVTNPISSPSTYSGAYGVEFSPDAQFLYTSTAFVGGSPDSVSRLYQFDLNFGNSTFNNGVELAFNNTAEYFCGLQLATDGRIYVARSPFGFDALGVIYNPRRPGTECNFNYLDGSTTGFNLGGKRSKYGFPIYMQSFFDVPHFDAEMICFSDTTLFKLTNPANVQSVLWNFGDGNTSSSLEPVHIFGAAGNYQVTVTENGAYTYTEQVTINELPMPQIPDTAYMYRGASILLNAGEGFQSYEWYSDENGITGQNSSVIKVSEPGTYWVTVQNERCCFNTDSVVVLLYDIVVPNAFRPGGVNSLFRAVPSTEEAITNFTMFVYNRWGQQLYQSSDIHEGWDGNVNGNPAPGDVYIWIIYYDIEQEGSTERIAYKGNVVLLR